MGSNHHFFRWAQTTNLLGGLKPPTFRLGWNHQLFCWARTTNLPGGLKPPTEADEGIQKKSYFQHYQVFAKNSFNQQKQLVLFFLKNKKKCQMHLM